MRAYLTEDPGRVTEAKELICEGTEQRCRSAIAALQETMRGLTTKSQMEHPHECKGHLLIHCDAYRLALMQTIRAALRDAEAITDHTTQRDRTAATGSASGRQRRRPPSTTNTKEV